MPRNSDVYSYGCIHARCEVLLSAINELSKELLFYSENDNTELHEKSTAFFKKRDDFIKIIKKINEIAVE